MSEFVVDASVGMKWFIPEPWDAEAQRLLVGPTLHVPSLFFVEMGSILRKKVLAGVLSRTEADDILARFPGMAVQVHADAALVCPAFDVAVQTGATIYDCLYLALAVRLGAQLVTADDAFVARLMGTAWAGAVMRVQDIP